MMMIYFMVQEHSAQTNPRPKSNPGFKAGFP